MIFVLSQRRWGRVSFNLAIKDTLSKTIGYYFFIHNEQWNLENKNEN